MLSLSYKLEFGNITTMLWGLLTGFFIMVVISCAIIAAKLNKKSKNPKIREISKKAYGNYKASKAKLQNKLISALYYEVSEAIKLVHPDNNNAFFELSINEIIDGIKSVNTTLKKIINHPLCKDIKKIHILFIFDVNNKVITPVKKIISKNVTKAFILLSDIFWRIVNLVNPVYYMRKFLLKIISKKGRKDLFIISFDIIGNACYDIYYKANFVDKSKNSLIKKQAN